MINKFIDWLLHGLSKDAQSEKDEEIKRALSVYLKASIKLLLIMSLVVLAFVLITIIDFSSFESLRKLIFDISRPGKFDLKLDGETLAAYVGIAFGTVVALAGSIVAITLAIRADQVARIANKLQEEAVHLQIGSRPEYAKGLDAAMAYARFKSLIVVLPMTLRHMQRDGKIEDADEMNNLLKKLVDELINTSLVSLLPNIALRSPSGEDLQRIFEQQFSHIGYSKDFIQGLSISLELTREADLLISSMFIENSLSKYDYYSMFSKEEQSQLGEVEFWFLKHVHEYAKLNSNIRYEEVRRYSQRAEDKFWEKSNFSTPQSIPFRGRKIQNAPTLDVQSFEDALVGKIDKHLTTPILVFCLNDTWLYKIGRYVRFAANKLNIGFAGPDLNLPSCEDLAKPGIQRVIIGNRWDVQLAELLRRLHEAGDTRKSEVVLLLDQLESYQEVMIAKPYKYFLLSDHIRLWLLCHYIDKLIDDEDYNKQLALDQLRTLCGFKGAIPNPEEWEEGMNAFWSGVGVSLHSSQLDLIFRDVDENTNLPRMVDEPESFHLTHWIQSFLVQEMPCKEDEFAKHLDLLDPSEKEAIKNLGKIPLFERPVYGWKCGPDSWDDVPSAFPINLNIIGLVYPNSALDTKSNMMLEWLMFAAKGKEDLCNVYRAE